MSDTVPVPAFCCISVYLDRLNSIPSSNWHGSGEEFDTLDLDVQFSTQVCCGISCNKLTDILPLNFKVKRCFRHRGPRRAVHPGEADRSNELIADSDWILAILICCRRRTLECRKQRVPRSRKPGCHSGTGCTPPRTPCSTCCPPTSCAALAVSMTCCVVMLQCSPTNGHAAVVPYYHSQPADLAGQTVIATRACCCVDF